MNERHFMLVASRGFRDDVSPALLKQYDQNKE
jgi:hypothetical protein